MRSPTAQTVGTLVRQYSSTLTKPRSMLDAGLLVAEARRDGPAADGDEQQLGLDRLAVLEGDRHAAVGVLDAGSGAELDAALAEGPLQQLEAASSSSGDEVGQCLDDGARGLRWRGVASYLFGIEQDGCGPLLGLPAARVAGAGQPHHLPLQLQPGNAPDGQRLDPGRGHLRAGRRADVGAAGRRELARALEGAGLLAPTRSAPGTRTSTRWPTSSTTSASPSAAPWCWTRWTRWTASTRWGASAATSTTTATSAWARRSTWSSGCCRRWRGAGGATESCS